LIKEENHARQVDEDPDDSWLAQPDLSPMQALAGRAELAEAVSHLAGSTARQLRPDDPLAPLARDLARAPTLARFTLHHYVPDDPLYRLGGGVPAAGCRGAWSDGMQRGGRVVDDAQAAVAGLGSVERASGPLSQR
jgi:hypothetical protein